MDITWDDYLGENWWGWQESSSTEVEPTFSPSTGMSTWSGYWEDVHFFSADFFGTHLTFQWYYSSDKITWSPILDATRATYKIASMMSTEVAGGQGYYKCVATNNKGTASGMAQAICVMHPFTYEGEGLGGMGKYERYDQRTDFTTQAGRSFYVGIGDSSNIVKDNVFAWAKDSWLNAYYQGNNTGNDFYLGCYGARGCTVKIENCTGYIGAMYLSSGSEYDYSSGTPVPIRVSRDNHLIIRGGVLNHTGGEWLIPGFPWGPVAGQNQGDNSITIDGGAKVTLRNNINLGWGGWLANTGSEIAVNNIVQIIGTGTMLRMDSQINDTQWWPMMIYFHYGNSTVGIAGNAFSIENYAIVVGGKCGSYDANNGGWRYMQSPLLSFNGYSSYDETTDAWLTAAFNPFDNTLRFGGGFLAHFGDCTGNLTDSYDSNLGYFKWDFSDWSSYRDICPLAALQVRDADGTWRAAKADDFTVTYCATDAEGLAATGGLYDGLAGYTIITAGASIT